MRPTTIIPLAGILARGAEQHKPLDLGRFGSVEALDYRLDKFGPDLFTPDSVHKVLAQRLLHTGSIGAGVTVLGSSLGGCHAAFGAAKALDDGADLSKVKIIIVDSPSGAGTFEAVKKLPPSLVASPFTAAAMSALGGPFLLANRKKLGLPNDDQISMPDAEDMRRLAGRDDFTEEEWRSWVKKEAGKGLKGHSASVWGHQVNWMAMIGQDGSLDARVRRLDGLDITYIMCTGGNGPNGVVVQPDAADWWTSRCDANLVEVEAAHCGYLQQLCEFKPVIDRLLAR